MPGKGWLVTTMKLDQRHRTAIRCITLSRPLRIAIEVGIIGKDSSVLDYGYGRGDDINELQACGIRCYGWEPIYRPNGIRRDSEVVNLGYVVNVIEDPAERADTLREAWKRAHKMLLVSAQRRSKGVYLWHYNDGYLTRTTSIWPSLDPKAQLITNLSRCTNRSGWASTPRAGQDMHQIRDQRNDL